MNFSAAYSKTFILLTILMRVVYFPPSKHNVLKDSNQKGKGARSK